MQAPKANKHWVLAGLINDRRLIPVVDYCLLKQAWFLPTGHLNFSSVSCSKNGIALLTYYTNKMENPENLLESLIENAEAYGKTTYELSKLKLLEGITVVMSALLSKLIFMIVISLFAFVLSIGVSLMLGDLLGKSYYGFFIVALFYLIVSLVFKYAFQKRLKKSITDALIVEMLQK